MADNDIYTTLVNYQRDLVKYSPSLKRALSRYYTGLVASLRHFRRIQTKLDYVAVGFIVLALVALRINYMSIEQLKKILNENIFTMLQRARRTLQIISWAIRIARTVNRLINKLYPVISNIILKAPVLGVIFLIAFHFLALVFFKIAQIIGSEIVEQYISNMLKPNFRHYVKLLVSLIKVLPSSVARTFSFLPRLIIRLYTRKQKLQEVFIISTILGFLKNILKIPAVIALFSLALKFILDGVRRFVPNLYNQIPFLRSLHLFVNKMYNSVKVYVNRFLSTDQQMEGTNEETATGT